MQARDEETTYVEKNELVRTCLTNVVPNPSRERRLQLLGKGVVYETVAENAQDEETTYVKKK